jgi:hypothetical protein
MVSRERQLNFLLPINNARSADKKCTVASTVTAIKEQSQDKRYIQIKQSLRAKGLMKSPKY